MNLTRIAARMLPRRAKEAAKKEIHRRFGIPSMESSLENMSRLGFRPAGVIDIGAYKGEWTEMARKIFPKATFLMLEAQESQRETLKQVKGRCGSSVEYRIALLGPGNREGVEFHQHDIAPTASSVLTAHGGTPGRVVRCKMETLDTILNREGFRRPELIKIDVQGYELEVLKGATEALATVEAIAMEVSLLELYKGNPLMHEVITFMLERGFQCYDIPSLMRRPSDLVLWQVDMIFVRKGSPLFKDKTGVVPEASVSNNQL
jgi:FkbM family methyltransferase